LNVTFERQYFFIEIELGNNFTNVIDINQFKLKILLGYYVDSREVKLGDVRIDEAR